MWKWIQSFGQIDEDCEFVEDDVITITEFDPSGKYFVTGDKGGRIVLFRRNDEYKEGSLDDGEKKQEADEEDRFQSPSLEWNAVYQFVSHQSEFDFLKSIAIPESILDIKFCEPEGDNNIKLLSANEKVVRYWKITEKSTLEFEDEPASSFVEPVPDDFDDDDGVDGISDVFNFKELNRCLPDSEHGHDKKSTVKKKHCTSDRLSLPRLRSRKKGTVAILKESFAEAHTYHINSVSVNSDGETFVSADDLRINWWNLNVPYQCFNVVDLKPPNMEELLEVITCTVFHPSECNILSYSSSRGMIRTVDSRVSALGDNAVRTFTAPGGTEEQSFFSEIIASISNIKYSRDGRYLVARDYLTLKVWDSRNEANPVQVVNLDDSYGAALCDLYESDQIFDKFNCDVSPDFSTVITGGYNGQLHCCRSSISADDHNATTGLDHLRPVFTLEMPTSRKITQCAWHPHANIIAIAQEAGLHFWRMF
jgi:serine/threonine-protein phosphatase 2A regulatory subunit B